MESDTRKLVDQVIEDKEIEDLEGFIEEFEDRDIPGLSVSKDEIKYDDITYLIFEKNYRRDGPSTIIDHFARECGYKLLMSSVY